MKKNYVTLVYLSQDSENANYLSDILEDKHVEVHKFEKGEDSDSDILRDIKDSCGLIILHISDDFDYGDYLPEIKKANGKCQIICCYTTKAVYQSHYPLNEIVLVDGYPIEALANDICCIVVGGYNKIKVNSFNRKKYRKEAFALFKQEHYVWSLCYLLKVFRIHDLDVKERIADAYASLMDCDKAINYYSICLPLETNNSKGFTDEDSQGMICNNLGYLYTQTKNLEFAERYLKQAIEYKNPDALYNLGYLYESSWAYDSKMRRTKEGYDLYCKVLAESYTSEASKERAREKLKNAADRLLKRKNYAAALQYYKAIGDGAKAAECIRNIKRIRQLYEERKKRQTQ
ncbi:MAG: tetratricopeptide repeat protein [Anaeroplasma sp.]